ncbi:hypothetical protein [Mangrovimonas spongiae]|uniref:Lipoprotein n=1 Tax=Mangrovimonas spongiae TaxID=2494697 RepID=A0A3R9MG98_9FLAO|nr:hypothetical protein [Mangrovimonas spongiae]RSK41410.1 hypothetical protein EJA19_00620 [Mangrovimonas spongiae]
MKNLLAIIVIIFTLLVSCKKNKKEIKNIEESQKVKESFISLTFPDTVEINEDVKGYVEYYSAFDTITKKLYEGEDTLRIITMYIKQNEIFIPNNTKGLLNSKVKDSFYPRKEDVKERNPIIHFSKKFGSEGKHYLEVLLRDEVLIDTADTKSLRLLEKHLFISKPIYVKNK